MEKEQGVRSCDCLCIDQMKNPKQSTVTVYRVLLMCSLKDRLPGPAVYKESKVNFTSLYIFL